MNTSRIPELKRTTQQIVREACRPGGRLERGEFTMAVARNQIAHAMGLGHRGLDEKRWKGVVRGEVNEALELVAQTQSSPAAAAPQSSTHPNRAEEVEAEEVEAGPSSGTPTRPKASARAPPPRIGKKASPILVEDDEEEEEAGQARMADRAEEIPPNGALDAGTDSDMSSVYDVEPVKKRRKRGEGKDEVQGRKASDGGKSKTKSKADKRGKKATDEGLSPDEARVVELKRIVVACGVRKQWSKEFADCPTPRSQIQHLQGILHGLGMKGTPTIGKAKSLKERRELAAELDDVRAFEASRGVSAPDLRKENRRSSEIASRPSRRKGVVEGVVSDDGEEGSSDDEQPAPKEKSALASVLDFLGEDSDD